ncbi:MAG: hypothetical protein WBY47_05540 [Desulfobacterales bacterium]|jgi:hypothetical protein
MSLGQKLTVLNTIYRHYDEFTGGLNIACKKNCTACCTPDVTMTTLEGYLIADSLISNSRHDLFGHIQKGLSGSRFKPRTTTNKLAILCAKGDDPPQEPRHDDGKHCLLLMDGLCPIYPARPFGCRCFISEKECSQTGYAEVDPFIITVNTVYLQVIEHIDAAGFSGNFADIMLLMAKKENRDRYRKNTLKHLEGDFVSNIPIEVLMVPPEHRNNVKPILKELFGK